MPGEAHLDQIRAAGRRWLTMAAAVAVCVAVLTGVHRLTAFDTVRQEEARQQEILARVMPQADMITESPYLARDARSISFCYGNNELLGYCVEVQSNGFGGLMTLWVGVNLNGEVTGVMIGDHHEVQGVGTQAMSEASLKRYIGMSGTITMQGSNSVDAVSGATATSRAITAGVNKALNVVANLDTGGAVDYLDGQV